MLRFAQGVLALPIVGMLAVSGLAAEPPKLAPGTTLTPGTIAFAADFAAAPNQFYRQDGTADGLDVDLCGALGKKLGANVQWVNLAFPGLVPGLQAKRFDALCTAIFITPEREKIMNMVAYVQWGEGLMLPKSAPFAHGCSFKSGDDASYNACFDTLAGKVVSVAAAGTTNRHLRAESDRIAAAGKAAIDIRPFDTNADAIQAVVSGQADAAYLNDPQAHFFIDHGNPGYDMAFTGYMSNKLALAVLKSQTVLAETFKAGLEAMKADGSYDAILNKWGVAPVATFAINP